MPKSSVVCSEQDFLCFSAQSPLARIEEGHERIVLYLAELE